MYTVIMAGGSGTRFWPASRMRKPKQFINIGGKNPMVVETCNRLSPLAQDEEMILVLGRQHLGDAKELFKDRNVHMVAEPVGRNTAPCIGLGAIYAQYLGCSGPVAFLPADHLIGDPSAFVEGLEKAGEIAESGGIVTLGIVPTRPETGYGYIRRSEAQPEAKDQPVYKVSAFVEKPDQERAREYFSSREYFWNAGIFVATPKTILGEIQSCLPGLHEGLKRLEKVLGTNAFEQEIEAVYEGLEAISFDYGVMERTRAPILAIPCECGWTDVGSWASLYEWRETDLDEHRNLAEGDALLVDCEGSFVSTQSGRLVACLGLKNCVVVDTPEALLVADMAKSQDIRKIIEELKRARKEELL